MFRFAILFTFVVLLLSTAACDSLPASLLQSSGECARTDGVFPKPEPEYTAKRTRDFGPFENALNDLPAGRTAELDALLQGKTVLDIQELFESAELSSEELVTYYVARMQRYDVDGLNSVMEINPQALAIARDLDDERAGGSTRGDMHGIPVLLKDNIATGDGLHAAAGAAALADWQPDRDAFLVQQLRDNGAVILGKANLSEWANWVDSCMPNGFSALGGQTRNPYGPFETFGSSSGSAVSVAANLTAVSVGSETQGSLILPSAINSVVGLKTSKGLVSGDYIIPLLPFQDVAGPMGRTVSDVAVLLTAMTGVDESAPNSQDAAALAGTDFTQFLAPEAIEGLKIGVQIVSEADAQAMFEAMGLPDDQLQAAVEATVAQNEAGRQQYRAILEPAGLEIVEVPSSDLPAAPDAEAALTPGYKFAINAFLAGLGDAVAVSSLDEIVAFNNEDPANRIPYGQDHLEASLASEMSDEDYATLREEHISSTRDALHALFEKNDIDVLIADSNFQAYAPAGFPAISVPSGYGAAGQPASVIMVGNYLGEPALISAAYALEQAIQARVEPDLEATMKQIEALSN